jgi:cardiolipin synthase
VSQLWNFANQITLFRLAVIPMILIAMLYGRPRPALWLFLLAAVTDAVDGIVARRLNQRTAIGAYLDPIADKFLLSSSFFVLALIHSVPWWVTILVLSRDVMILATALVVAVFTEIRRFPPTFWGKLNTGIQVATVFTVVLRDAYPFAFTEGAARIAVLLTAVSTVISGVHYAFRMSGRLEKDS